VIWEPFVLALVLGLIISAGLYFAYLWPSVEPVEPTDEADAAAPATAAPEQAAARAAGAPDASASRSP
jgi:hypothetical protein